MVNQIVSEVLEKYIGDKCMLKEYKNPKDSETIRVCTDTLEQLYKDIIYRGTSKHECNVVQLGEIINKLRKIEKNFQ